MKKELQNIKMGMTWSSYIAAAHGVLSASNLWQGEIWQLMGSTGMAFQLIAHETACPSSVTMYDWNLYHFQMMDRIGIYTDSICIVNQPGMNTYEKLKEDAIRKIKEAIDAGRGVVIWAPSRVLEFGIIRGYDDAEQVFQITDCTNATGENLDPLLYDNVGKSEVPFIYIQRFIDKVTVDPEKIYRESLLQGVRHWDEKHYDSRYAYGHAAYAHLITALQKGNYDEFGLTYLINVYEDYKKCLALYLADLVKQTKYLKNLEKTAALFKRIQENFRIMAEIAPFRGPGSASINKQQIPEMVTLLKQSLELESSAMLEIKNSLGQEE